MCVCIIIRNTAYCSRNYFPRGACLCSSGSSLMLAVFNPKQLPGLPFSSRTLLQCRVEVNGKDIDQICHLAEHMLFNKHVSFCLQIGLAEICQCLLGITLMLYTRKTVNAFIAKKRWARTGFVMLSCIWAYFLVFLVWCACGEGGDCS